MNRSINPLQALMCELFTEHSNSCSRRTTLVKTTGNTAAVCYSADLSLDLRAAILAAKASQ